MQPINLQWKGGEHDFALPLEGLRALQESCDAGPEEIYNRLRLGVWRVDDVTEVLRLGLIHGEMPRESAGPLVTRLFDQGAVLLMKLTAIAVLQHALLGPEDDQPGEDDGAEETETAPENGNSPRSTETAQ